MWCSLQVTNIVLVNTVLVQFALCETHDMCSVSPKLKTNIPEPEIPVNPMLKNRARGTHGCCESLAVGIEWLECTDPCIGTLAHWPVTLP